MTMVSYRVLLLEDSFIDKDRLFVQAKLAIHEEVEAAGSILRPPGSHACRFGSSSRISACVGYVGRHCKL